jgi:phosphonate transport system substrate-binding protein
MPRDNTLRLGAVAYDAKVVPIWDGFQQYFAKRGLGFDYILYSNYERQVAAHCAGHLDVAWNSPLAWLETESIARAAGRRAEALLMRDTDRDLTSLVVARTDTDILAPGDLRGKRVAVGAKDSPQATLIPLACLAREGVRPEVDCEVIYFDALAGKHGDHIGGERDAARAMMRGEADAACMIDSNHLAFIREGTLPGFGTRILMRTPVYDHCNFTVLDGFDPQLLQRFRELMLAMDYADPEVRPLLDMEGLKKWLPGRTSGYTELAAAVERFGTIAAFVSTVAAQCTK